MMQTDSEILSECPMEGIGGGIMSQLHTCIMLVVIISSTLIIDNYIKKCKVYTYFFKKGYFWYKKLFLVSNRLLILYQSYRNDNVYQ